MWSGEFAGGRLLRLALSSPVAGRRSALRLQVAPGTWEASADLSMFRTAGGRALALCRHREPPPRQLRLAPKPMRFIWFLVVVAPPWVASPRDIKR